MKTSIIIFLLTIIFSNNKLANCQPHNQSEPQLISSKTQNASGPFFTTNHQQQPVLVWTESLPNAAENTEPENVIKFATFNQSNGTFEEPVIVTSSKGCRAHDESMNKIAFKKDGTIVAVYSKRTPHKENRFAGALFYTQSFDGGLNWSAPNYLHVGDTTLGLSRSFFDLATLPNGEVGAVWLDSRLTKKRGDGSSLFFAKTDEQKGFLKDQPIAYQTCECCRTELFVADEKIHIAYRDIMQDTIRDMAHLVSLDNGATFTKPTTISPDNWMINGCPHTGPAMANTTNQTHFAWYTMGGGEGVYYNFLNENETFSPRQLITANGKHPQMLATSTEQLVFVWEEGNNKTARQAHHHKTPQTKTKKSETEKTKQTSYIKAQVWQNQTPSYEHWVSLSGFKAEFPVITNINNEYVGIAWVQNISENEYGIYFKKLKL